MAVDTHEKRAAASAVCNVFLIPAVVPDAVLSRQDRATVAHSFYTPTGEVKLYLTLMFSGVVSVSYDGVTFDGEGNVRIKGQLYEGDA